MKTIKRSSWMVMLVMAFLAIGLSACGSDNPLEKDKDSSNSSTPTATQPASATQATTSTATQPASTATAAATPSATVASGTPGGAPGGQPGSVNVSSMMAACLNNKPADLEALDRSTVTAAPLGQWFHPIFKSSLYQSSGGFDGQWSWAHTLCLGQADGGQFRHFEDNNGRFIFRHTAVNANVAFAVLTTSKWKSQFMEGANHDFSVNIKALPGTTIWILGDRGAVLGSQQVSRAGDLTIILPDDGVTGFYLTQADPPTTHEVQIWFGPYDRSEGINTFPAKNR